MYKALFFLTLFLSSNFIIAQIRLKPEVIRQAEILKKEYPKQEFVSLSTKSTYSFELSSSNKKVECNEQFNEHIMSLKEKQTFRKTVFFNEESNVLNLLRTNYKGVRRKTYFSYSRYGSDGIFYDDAKIARFSFFLETRGDNSKYTYTKSYKDIKYFTRAFFHTYYPREESKLVFVIPDWLELEFVPVNFENFDVQKEEKYDANSKTKTITYTLLKAEAMVGGKYEIAPTQQIPHLLILSKSFTYKNNKTDLFSTTAELYKWYKSLVDEMDNDLSVFKSKVDELTADTKSDSAKIENIFYWVQDNIRYIAYEDGIMGFKPANADDVYTNRFGDCKGMANLTCEMLRAAGFDARLTWIGTRRIPYTYKTPSLAVDNHMITTLMFNGQEYFLDATEKGIAFGGYANRIQGQDVLIENGSEYILSEVPEYDDTYNLKKRIVNLSLVDDELIGTGKNEYHGDERVGLFRDINMVSKAELFEKVGRYLGNFNKNNSVSDITISDFSDRSKPISFEYAISIANKITQVEKERYISLELDHDFANMKTEENRNMSLDFHQKMHINRITTLAVPKNMKVDYLPEAVSIDNDEFKFNLAYTYDQSTRNITYTKTLIIKNSIVSVSNFDVWNNAIKKLKTIYNDQVVLIEN